ncbi:alkaline shock response membrane anchor protein AmaP [Actinophytocola algeriensis]|nr:alkaline shock response membrane anchor protein AmaP [Actinophytocola algeriensis]
MNRPARLNRGLLAIIGVALVTGGGLAMATSLGMLPVDPATTLVPGTGLPPTWVLYAVAGVAVLLALLCLRWLTAQLVRTPRTHTWRFEDDPEHGHTELAARVATTPFTADVTAYPGIHTAHADLTGPQHSPTLAVVVTTEHDADLSDIRHRLDTDGLPRLRRALDLTSLPMTLEFRFTTKPGARTV